MNEAFEKILERLEEAKNFEYLNGVKRFSKKERNAFDDAKQIVQEVVEEYNGGWIACSESLPEETGEYLVTSKIYFVPDHVDEIYNYVCVKISHYSTRYGWLDDEVMAWQPLPEKYKDN